MKKVLILACAAFFSGQLMAQTTKKAVEAAPAPTTEIRAKAAEVVPVKTPVPSPVDAKLSPEAMQAATAAPEARAVAPKVEKTAELSTVAPTPSLAKPEPIKE